MTQFIATLRAVFDAPDEALARAIAEEIAINGSKELEEEEGDSLAVTQVTSYGLLLEPQEVLVKLRLARNLLIQTRAPSCIDVARMLDEQIYMLEHRTEGEPAFALAGYDYGAFMETCKQILTEGRNPLQ